MMKEQRNTKIDDTKSKNWNVISTPQRKGPESIHTVL